MKTRMTDRFLWRSSAPARSACRWGRICASPEAGVFGKPMQTWRESMPPGMLLRSAWDETSLSAPGGRGSIGEWSRASGEPRVEPIPLEALPALQRLVPEQFVGELDAAEVAKIETSGRWNLPIARRAAATRSTRIAFVLAVGVMPFQHVPDELRDVVGPVSTSPRRTPNSRRCATKTSPVVGGGQSALETAGLAAQAGARGRADHALRGALVRRPRAAQAARASSAERLYRLAYPAVGYGPPPLNRLVLHPDLYAQLPASVRTRLTKRLLRPGGSPWLRELVDGRVKMREGARIREVDRSNGRLKLRLDDGSQTHADHVLVAAGYRFSLDSLSFLSPGLRSRIATKDGWPALDRYFRSVSEPRVFFVGYAAEGRFGPISRYVLGTEFTANRVRECLD